MKINLLQVKDIFLYMSAAGCNKFLYLHIMLRGLIVAVMIIITLCKQYGATESVFSLRRNTFTSM